MTLPFDPSPSVALQHGTWFKLICGASFQHLTSVQDLAFLYTLAGADCVDMAADPAVVRAAQSGIAAARAYQSRCRIPWLMASFNDGQDPHFRKAQLAEASRCPIDCPQPCLQVCPPHAIGWTTPDWAGQVQIDQALCYGCGRCEPVCPHRLIETWGHQRSVGELLPELLELGIQAIEIHTQIGRTTSFGQVWQELTPWLQDLELVSISFNDGPGLEAYLRHLVQIMDPKPKRLIWQTDGRPMSGDLGAGTTGPTLRLAQKVLSWGLPGYVQLAGGTNGVTVSKLDPQLAIAGVAYGSYARQQVASALDCLSLQSIQTSKTPLDPTLFEQGDPQQLESLNTGVELARSLVSQIKSRPHLRIRDPVGAQG